MTRNVSGGIPDDLQGLLTQLELPGIMLFSVASVSDFRLRYPDMNASELAGSIAWGGLD